jgi:hypothetical protein
MKTLVSVIPPKENTIIFVHFPNNQSTPNIGVAHIAPFNTTID